MTVARIALTLGEPAGVGPDICLKLASLPLEAQVVLVGCAQTLKERAKELDIPIDLVDFDAASPPKANGNHRIDIVDVPLVEKCIAGDLNVANASAVLKMLDKAFELCASKQTAALVTAPIHKAIIQQSGVPFLGHTEYLAALAGVESVLMTFYTPEIIVGMATTHVPLRDVSHVLTPQRLESAIRLLHQGLVNTFHISSPRIRVLGLNPHAGEYGKIGDEEQSFMFGLIRKLKEEGLPVSGPVSGDTAFTPENRKSVDAYLAMYHDQGIAPIKALYFGDIVNITLGLPFLRTSVDHGTALEIAGTGLAKESSLIKALQLALHYSTIEKAVALS